MRGQLQEHTSHSEVDNGMGPMTLICMPSRVRLVCYYYLVSGILVQMSNWNSSDDNHDADDSSRVRYYSSIR